MLEDFHKGQDHRWFSLENIKFSQFHSVLWHWMTEMATKTKDGSANIVKTEIVVILMTLKIHQT